MSHQDSAPPVPGSGSRTEAPRSERGSERGKGGKANVVLWVLQVLIALAFLTAAIGKLTANSSTVHTFDQIGFGHWFMYLMGILELAGTIGILIPRLCGLAALAFVGLMIGAFITELAISASTGNVLVPVIYLIPVAIVAWGRRDRTARLIADLKAR
jgi:uncharacterized membrane protein YphA (DoxX/SURF4 family)